MENKDLKCTQCEITKEYLYEIVYSQGNKVCLECKKNNEQSDKKAFDRDMSFR